MNKTAPHHRLFTRLAVWLVTASFLLASVPPSAVLAASNDTVKAVNSLKSLVTEPKTTPGQRAVKNTKVTKIPLTFSASTSDEELRGQMVFAEPLVPMLVKTVPGENQALSKAITAFIAKKDNENISDLTTFLTEYPKSRWRASLELDLGLLRYETGYISDAIKLWQAAWDESKDERGSAQIAVANRAYGELAIAKSRLGRKSEIQKLIAEAGDRPLYGSVAERIKNAKYGLWAMDNMPGDSFKCGPYAINSLLNNGKKVKTVNDLVKKSKSTSNGTSLVQVRDLAKQAGLNYQAAKRSPGAPIIVPSVMHWSVGHYAAVLQKTGDKYFVNDPTFDHAGNRLLSPKALETETDGYFLIPAGSLPPGWKQVSDAEAAKVWGKGEAFGWCFGCMNCNTPKCVECGNSCAMAVANAYKSQGTLNIQDTPLSYHPPIGTDMNFLVNYNYLEANQPSTFNFTNITQNWTISWLSYCTVDASNNVTIRTRGGGSEYYPYTPPPDNFTSPYSPDLYTQAQLAQDGGGFQRLLPDGSMEVFALQSGSASTSYFLTQVIDPRGNVTTINYTFTSTTGPRISTIVDAIGQTTNFNYVSTVTTNPGYYQVASIVDPFSRSCTFTYDSTSTYLTQIQDCVGIQSQFSYLTGSSFIYMMSTPYGVTSFYSYGNAAQNGLVTTYPDGTCSQIQSNIGIVKTSYYWDREASASYPSDSQASTPQWAEATLWELEAAGNGSTGVMSSVPWTIQKPLQDLITFSYDGMANGENTGSINKPTQICQGPDAPPAPPLPPSPHDQYYNYQYNPLGKVTQYIDPVGRTFTYKYAANNIDLLEARQTRLTNNDLLGKWEYNNTQHLANVYIDGSGQTTQYTFNTYGELTSVTDAQPATTTFNYQAGGPLSLVVYPQTIVGPSGFSNDITTVSFDSVGRVHTVQDPLGYTLTFTYDNMDRLLTTTYPDTTVETTTWYLLDPVIFQDRLGRITQDTYDSMRELVKHVDSLGRTTQYAWCSCGSLSHLTDGNGNETTWYHDVLGRPIQKVYADGSQINYTYEQLNPLLPESLVLGRLSAVTDALGQVKTFSYYMDNTVQAITYTNVVNPTPNPNRSFTYDSNYRRLATATNSWGTLTYSYNPYITDPFGATANGAGNLSGITNGVIAYSDMAFQYDSIGRLASRSVNNVYDTFGYDLVSRLTSETNVLGSFAYEYGTTASYGTHELADIKYPIGSPTQQKTTFTWGATSTSPNFEQLIQITNVAGGISPPNLSQYSQTYNSAIDITQWLQTLYPGGTPTTNTINLGYDLCDQLLTASGTTSYAYGYDSSANRTSSTVGSTTTTATPNDLNQITALSGGTTATLTYDANGNMTSDGTNSYTWDVENRLVNIKYGATTYNSQFTYDPVGGLIKIVDTLSGGTATKQFVRTSSRILEERDASGAVQAQFFGYGQTRSGSNYYLTRDHLGSVRDVTTSSAATQVQYSYDLYGKATASTGVGMQSDFQYAGYYFHGPSGLNLTVNRAYNPALGRWLNRDPIQEEGGVNLYAYVHNNPVSFVDPTGDFGAGLAYGADAAGGIGGVGYAATVGGGSGFFSGDGSANGGSFITAGNTNGIGGGGGPINNVIGASAGAGIGGFVTSANKLTDLKGPFSTTIVSISNPVVPGTGFTGTFGIDKKWTTYGSLTYGPSIGPGSISQFTTNTWTFPGNSKFPKGPGTICP